MLVFVSVLASLVTAVPVQSVQQMTNSTNDLLVMAQKGELKRNHANNCKCIFQIVYKR